MRMDIPLTTAGMTASQKKQWFEDCRKAGVEEVSVKGAGSWSKSQRYSSGGTPALSKHYHYRVYGTGGIHRLIPLSTNRLTDEERKQWWARCRELEVSSMEYRFPRGGIREVCQSERWKNGLKQPGGGGQYRRGSIPDKYWKDMDFYNVPVEEEGKELEEGITFPACTEGLSHSGRLAWWDVCKKRGVLFLQFRAGPNNQWSGSSMYPSKDEPYEGGQYCISQEEYHRVFGTPAGEWSPIEIEAPTTKENIMKYEKKVFIDNLDAATLTTSGIIGIIVKWESEVKALKAVKTPSKKVKKLIKELQTACTKAAGYLDRNEK